MATSKDVDAYIEAAPAPARAMLIELRQLIFEAAPLVTEKIKYGMPTYEDKGRPLLNLSAAKSHVGVYGLVHVDSVVPEDLAAYLDHRSTLHFPFDRPLPAAALAAAIRDKVAS